jgi:hypothetical protein
MATLQQYLSLISSEHQNSPNYLKFISIFLQGQVDNQNVNAALPGLFDVDVAVGQQLDFIGVRVGQSRQIAVELTGVYFTWGETGPGWGQGTWYKTGDSLTSLSILPDDSYRVLLKAVIAANQWDGSVPGAYAVWAIAFGPNQIALRDNQNMTMDVIWIGPAPNAVTLALLTSGHLNLKPAGVRITGYYLASVVGDPNSAVTLMGPGS